MMFGIWEPQMPQMTQIKRTESKDKEICVIWGICGKYTYAR